MWSNDTLSILVAEDSDEDFDMLMLTFKRFGIRNEVIRCQQGEEVIPAIERMKKAHACSPSLIVLDLNLIGLDGREVLKQLKSSPAYKRIPVVVLTTSFNPKDVDYCYEVGANSYSVKPVNIDKFENFVRLLKSYWLDTCVLPHMRAGGNVGEPCV
jgi:CheY-like chemotaxis protein